MDARRRISEVIAGCALALVATLVVANPAFASDTTKPSAPQNLHVTATSETTISLAWTASTDNVGVTHYRVYQDGTAIGNPTGASYVVQKLWPHSTHIFYVTAFDAAGNESALSPMVTSYTKPDMTGPSAPPNLTGQFNEGTAISVTLHWQAATDNVMVDHYDVYRDLVKIGSTSALTYTDTTIAPNKTVKYLVMGVDEVGNSGQPSNQVQVISDVQSPTAPSGLRITATTSNSISLGWTPSTDNYAVASYDIYRNRAKVATQSSASGTTFYSGGLTPGTTYSFYVVARDSSNNLSNSSNTATSTTTGGSGGDTQPPSTPGTLRAKIVSGKVDLSWGASTDNVGVTGYAVIRNNSTLATATGLAWNDLSPLVNQWVSYSVKARDAAGNWSGASNTLVLYVDTVAPTTPTNVKATVNKAQTVTVTWSASTDQGGLKSYVIRCNGVRVAVIAGSATPLTWTDSAPPTGTYLRYTVQAVDRAGNRSTAASASTVRVL
jgi:chitodextrinase